MTWALLNLVAQADADRLASRLAADGYDVRRIDGRGVKDGPALWRAIGAAFGFDGANGWESLQDHIWQAIFMGEDDGERYAVVWEHADDMVKSGLGDLLAAVDVLQSVGRQAYEEDVHVLLFLLGRGRSFPGLSA